MANSTALRETLAVLNEMEADGIIGRHAICGYHARLVQFPEQSFSRERFCAILGRFGLEERFASFCQRFELENVCAANA